MMAPCCTLCGNTAGIWEETAAAAYHHCPVCDLIFLDPALRPDPRNERARYLTHHNSPEDVSYRAYLRGFAEEALLPFMPPLSSPTLAAQTSSRPAGAARAAKILDYGCGYSPVFVTVLQELGYGASGYDPLFAPGDSWRKEIFDAVTAVEVAEHFFFPSKEFRAISSVLRPGGICALRTLLHRGGGESFESWWYRRDPTHVSFYSKNSFEWIAGHFGFELIEVIEGRSVVLRRSY
jgi:SAM-dependent methyltransferase